MPRDDGGNLCTELVRGELINITPQNLTVNRGDYRAMELEIAKLAAEVKKIAMVARPIYAGDGRRPAAFEVQISVNGVLKNPL